MVNNEYRIQFKDSYLLLLDSLAKFTNSFITESQKGIFPYILLMKII
jgi:hypothetical protein